MQDEIIIYLDINIVSFEAPTGYGQGGYGQMPFGS